MERRTFISLFYGGSLPMLTGCNSLPAASGPTPTQPRTNPETITTASARATEGEITGTRDNWYENMVLYLRGLRTPWESDPSEFAKNYSQRLQQLALDVIIPGVEDIAGPVTDMADIVKASGESFRILNQAWAVQQIEQYQAEWCSKVSGLVKNRYRELDDLTDRVDVNPSGCNVIKPLFDAVIKSFFGYATAENKTEKKKEIRGIIRKVLDIFALVQPSITNSAVSDGMRKALNNNLKNYQVALKVLESVLTYDISSQKSNSPTMGVVDGFEDGDIDEYSGQKGGFQVQNSVVKNGDWALKGEVQSGNNQSIHRNVNFSQPDRVQGYVRVGHGGGNEDAHISYLSGGVNGSRALHINPSMNYGNNGFGDTSGEPKLVVNGQEIMDINHNEWYFIELEEIDWNIESVGKAFVNGALQVENIDFEESAGSIDTLRLTVNDWGNEPAWFDDVSVGSEPQNKGENSQTDQNPHPELEVTVPDEATVGEPFKATVTSQNTGARGGHWSTITMSFPSLNETDDGQQITILQDDFSEWDEISSAGDEITDSQGNPIQADYALVEAGTGDDNFWESGESHSLSVEITPEQDGAFVMYARTTLTDENDVSRKFTAPASENADAVDQQGYPVRQIQVDVNQPDQSSENTDCEYGLDDVAGMSWQEVCVEIFDMSYPETSQEKVECIETLALQCVQGNDSEKYHSVLCKDACDEIMPQICSRYGGTWDGDDNQCVGIED